MRQIQARYRQWIRKEIPLLEGEGILAPDTASRLRGYYDDQTTSGNSWALAVFATLGSLLIGAGIILLFAHNWDALGRPMRAVLSFVPLILGGVLTLYTVAQRDSVAWRESAGLFHSLAVGASIALVGQTYHLPSDTPAFLLTWALLILPLVFLLNGNGVLLIYLGLICGWAGAAQTTYGQAVAFWLLLLPAIARQVQLNARDPHAPDALLGVWALLITLCVGMGIAFERTVPGLWILAYAALLSGAALYGLRVYGDRDGWANPAKVFGVTGIAVLAYLFTWTEMWHDIGWYYMRHGWRHRAWGAWLDVGITLTLLTAWALLAVQAFRKRSAETVTLALFPLVAAPCFLLGCVWSDSGTVNAIIFNLFLLCFGIMYITLGCRDTRLRQLNGGMAILAVLIVTRFFDGDFGFLARGIAFILLGSAFLTVNVVMMRRKRSQEGSA